MSVFRPDEAQSSFETVLVHGGVNDQSKPGDEVSLHLYFDETFKELARPTSTYNTPSGSAPRRRTCITGT